MISGATESSFRILSQYLPLSSYNINVTPHCDIPWIHHSFDQLAAFELKKNLHRIKKIVFVSKWQQEQFIKYHDIPFEKTIVIHNGGSNVFQYSPQKEKTLIYTSTPFRGLKYVPKIFTEILKVHPDVKLKVFSSMKLYDPNNSDDDFNEIFEEIKALPNTEYYLPVEHDVLSKHLESSAFFFYPNTWEETSCVSMIEAMRCGCVPIISNIGALPETSNGFGAIIPMSGKYHSTGWIPDQTFIDEFVNQTILQLNMFDTERDKYNKISKEISDYAIEKHDWIKIANIWRNEVVQMNNVTEQKKIEGDLPIVTSKEAVDENNEFLNKAFDCIFKWEESDYELAQGRSNFQLEKFFLLEQHTIPAAFHATLKNRRVMAEGLMQKVIEMKRTKRIFEYKWGDKPKDQPIRFGKDDVLCWYDLDLMDYENYMRSSEMELKDRVQQLEFFDKILNKLVEMNGNKLVTREQFEAEDAEYWKRRFSDQAFDEIISRRTGISIGNLHSMRRATAPTLVSNDINRVDGFPSLSDALSEDGITKFALELQENIVKGIEEVTGKSIDSLKVEHNKTEQLDYNQTMYQRDSIDKGLEVSKGIKFFAE